MKKPEWLSTELETNLLTTRTIDVRIKELQAEIKDLSTQKHVLESEAWKSISRNKEISLVGINDVKIAIERGEYKIDPVEKLTNEHKPKKFKPVGNHPLDR